MVKLECPENLRNFKVPGTVTMIPLWIKTTELSNWHKFYSFVASLKDSQLKLPEALDIYKNSFDRLGKHSEIPQGVKKYAKNLHEWISVKSRGKKFETAVRTEKTSRESKKMELKRKREEEEAMEEYQTSCRLATAQVAKNLNHSAVALNNSVIRKIIPAYDNPFWPNHRIENSQDGFGCDSEGQDENANNGEDEDEDEPNFNSNDSRENNGKAKEKSDNLGSLPLKERVRIRIKNIHVLLKTANVRRYLDCMILPMFLPEVTQSIKTAFIEEELKEFRRLLMPASESEFFGEEARKYLCSLEGVAGKLSDFKVAIEENFPYRNRISDFNHMEHPDIDLIHELGRTVWRQLEAVSNFAELKERQWTVLMVEKCFASALASIQGCLWEPNEKRIWAQQDANPLKKYSDGVLTFRTGKSIFFILEVSGGPKEASATKVKNDYDKIIWCFLFLFQKILKKIGAVTAEDAEGLELWGAQVVGDQCAIIRCFIGCESRFIVQEVARFDFPTSVDNLRAVDLCIKTLGLLRHNIVKSIARFEFLQYRNQKRSDGFVKLSTGISPENAATNWTTG